MNKAYDRRFFFFLGFLFFLSFLGFLGTQHYQHLAALASPAWLASFAVFVLVPRRMEKIPSRYRLKDYNEVLRALIGQA